MIERAQVVTVKYFVMLMLKEDERISIKLVSMFQSFFWDLPLYCMMTFLRKLTRNRLLNNRSRSIRRHTASSKPARARRMHSHVCACIMHTPDRELFKVSAYDSYQNSVVNCEPHPPLFPSSRVCPNYACMLPRRGYKSSDIQ